MVIGPILAYMAVFYPGLSVLAIIFMVIGIRGIILNVL